MQVRLRDGDTGTYYVVDTAARTVCANLEERPRVSRADAVAGALAERALAAATEYEEYFARAVPGTRTPDGKFLAVATNGCVQLLSGTEVQDNPIMHESGTSCYISFSADGKHLVAVGVDLSVRQWETGTGKVAQNLGGVVNPPFTADANHMAYCPAKKLIAAIADPTHEQHQQMLTWCGGAFDPETPDVDRIAGELDRLARKWTQRPRKPKAASPRS